MALPVRYRDLLHASSAGQVVVTIDTEDRCLLLYPLESWEEIQAQLEALPNMNPVARRLQRLLIGHATDIELDSAGRVLLPQMLREYAELEKKLVLLGQGRKLEIWAEDVWTARRDQWLAETDQAPTDPTTELQSISL